MGNQIIVARYTETDIQDLDLPRKMMYSGLDHDYVILQLDCGDKIIKLSRQFISLLIGLRTHISAQLPLNKSHFNYEYKGRVSKRDKFKVWTNYYRELLEITDINHHFLCKG